MTTIETPGPYGWNATPEHRARVDAEVQRQRDQAARRRVEHATRIATAGR